MLVCVGWCRLKSTGLRDGKGAPRCEMLGYREGCSDQKTCDDEQRCVCVCVCACVYVLTTDGEISALENTMKQSSTERRRGVTE